jgi:hypothetical protein
LYHVATGKALVTALRHERLAFFSPRHIAENFDWPVDGPPVQPPLGSWILGWTHYLLDPSPDDPAVVSIAAARFAPAVAFGLLVLLTGWAATQWDGPVAGTVASAATFFVPRLFGHAHFAALDMLTALGFTAAVLATAAAVRQGGRWWAMGLAGVVWGLAMLTRLHGLLLLLPAIAWIVFRLRRRSVLPALVWTVSGMATLLAGWPWLWLDPWRRLRQFAGTGIHRQAVHVFYAGRVWDDRAVPWHYPLVMFLLALPLGLLILGGLGIWSQRTGDALPSRHTPCAVPDGTRRVPTTDRAPADAPRLHVLCRSLAQLEAVLACGVRSVMVDFQDIRHYAAAVEAAHRSAATILLATPRIQKPGELGIFRVLKRHGADGILVRNLAGLGYYAGQGVPAVADFSLNATNELTAQWLIQRGAARVTASYDMNRDQLLEMAAAVPPEWLEVVIHQHMPMFHMEHCVFCAVLSPGRNKTDCGRPCDRHQVRLRDRIGKEHPLLADVGCRNTLYNATPQSAAEAIPQLLQHGLRDFRIELLDGADPVRPADRVDSADPVRPAEVIELYRDLLAGKISGHEVWSRLRASNRVGVTRGTLEEHRNPDAML